jgi:hypothetical protein
MKVREGASGDKRAGPDERSTGDKRLNVLRNDRRVGRAL